MTATQITPAADQNDLARRAAAGDREAADQLFRSVEQLAWSLANRYARKFKPDVDADELFGEATLRFLICLPHYRGHIPFPRFFGMCVRRALAEYCDKRINRHVKTVQDKDGVLPFVAHAPAEPDNLPADRILAGAVAAITDPADRRLFQTVAGLRIGGARTVPAAARELGIDEHTARDRFAVAFNQASDHVVRAVRAAA